jgi:HK97 family phage prohead protease
MLKKTFRGAVTLKADGEPGEFRAVFSTLNVVDADGDVTVPGAFRDGQPVRISYWGHRWEDLPVGKGIIHADERESWVDGGFFLNTEGGRETYETVKALGDLQEWSYGFDILDAAPGQFEGRDVRFLRALDVHEVSPVMLGAGVGTRTTAIKVGARHTGKEFEMIQQIHDLAVDLGAKCAEADDTANEDDEGKAANGGKPRAPRTLAERLAIDLVESGYKE